MKIKKILFDRPYRYSQEQDEWEFFNAEDYRIRPGEVLKGHVEFSGRGKPPVCRIQWKDSRGRINDTTQGTYNSDTGFTDFGFRLDSPVSITNYIECTVDKEAYAGASQEFYIYPDYREWDDFHIFLWAAYPYAYYEELRKIGFDGIIAYKRHLFKQVLDNDFNFFVEQMTPEEMSIYHRPYTLFWEKPEKPTRPDRKSGWFSECWDALRQQYTRARKRLGETSVADDPQARKLLWRAYCLNDPSTWTRIRERIRLTVEEHRDFMPFYYCLGDEPGTGDQTAPFDFCFCEHCLRDFRSWLQKRYRGLADLNICWETSFTCWGEVRPFTTDDIMRREKKRLGQANFSPWADHREYMDDYMASAFSRMRRIGREYDPFGIFGIEGAQWPEAYGGWDYAKLVESCDLIEPYNIGANDEVIRSLNPKVKKLVCFFGDLPEKAQEMWFQLFHNDCGQLHWDWEENSNRFVQRPSMKRAKRAELFSPTLKELRGGIGKQVMSMDREKEKIGIHYSQASLRAHWMKDVLREGPDWINRDSSDNRADNRFMKLRVSWVKLIEDLGMQSGFVSYRDLEAGRLKPPSQGGCTVLILPQSSAISKTEAEALTRYVHGGGCLIADGGAGLLNEHCSTYEKPVLDNLFGIRRKSGGSGFFQKGLSGPPVKITNNTCDAMSLKIPEKGRTELCSMEPGISADPESGAESLGAAGRSKSIIVRSAGRGRTVYLNTDLADYCMQRFVLDGAYSEDARSLMRSVFEMCGVVPDTELTVKNSDNDDIQWPVGIEKATYYGRSGSITAFFTNAVGTPQKKKRGTGGESSGIDMNSFKRKLKLYARFPEKSHVYDTRGGTYLGFTDRAEFRFKPLEPSVFTRLPYRVESVEVQMITVPDISKNRQAAYRVALHTDPEGAAVEKHVLRVTVQAPEKGEINHYSENLLLERGGSVESSFRPALNDPDGTWKVEVTDILTGVHGECTFHYST